MRKITFLIIILAATGFAFSQDNIENQLFASQQPLDLKLKISFKELRKETDDSTYLDGVLHYKVDGIWDSVEVEMRKRGHFRLNYCYFAPLKLKFKKKKIAGTPFEGNKKLKLVLPCEQTPDNNALLIRELMCYKFYEQITPYSFSTRQVNLELTETSRKNSKTFQVAGFFIEDDDDVAQRNKAVIKENLNPHPLRLDDTVAIQHALFQYMISNLDWSAMYQHNAKIMVTVDPIKYIPLAYDFDHSGVVNAPYATIQPGFEVDNVRQRVYRGMCRDNQDLIYFVRNQYLSVEENMFAIIDSYSEYQSERDTQDLKDFISDFYDILKTERKFHDKLVTGCR